MSQPENPLRIQTPCPKKWEELTGRGAKRFCSECSLHVHDAARLKQAEAHALVTAATSRVCMRIEYDASGAPLFRDTRPPPPSWSKRAVRWTMSAAAGLLAACNGSFSSPPPSDPASGTDPAPQPGRLGEVMETKLGDVAAPPVPPETGNVVAPPTEPQMGVIALPPNPPEMGKVAPSASQPKLGKIAPLETVPMMGEAVIAPPSPPSPPTSPSPPVPSVPPVKRD